MLSDVREFGRTCLLAAMVVAPQAHAANTPSKFTSEHLAAASLLRERKWDEAVSAYRKIVTDGPNDSLAPNAQLGLARALLGSRKHDDAVAAFEALATLVTRLKSQGQLSGQQPEAAWEFTVQHGIGECYEEQKKYEEAAERYRQAAASFQKPVFADWRARAFTHAARCLTRAGRPDAAGDLLRTSIAELGRARFSGARAFQIATLARLMADQGDPNAAKELLAALSDDPHLDSEQLRAAEALVAGKPASTTPTDKLRTRRGQDYFAVESVGRFELRIALEPVGRNLFGDNRYGWIMAWYNLQDDPFKRQNLASLSYFPLIKPHHLSWLERRNGEWKRIDSKRFKQYSKTLDVKLGMQRGPNRDQKGNVKFEVLESSTARVRTRTSHDRWPFETLEYTFYPTGQLFVSAGFDLEHEDPPLRIGSVSFYTAKNPQFNWRDAVDETSRMSGEGGSQYPARFVLSHTNPVPSFQMSVADDILTCSAEPHTGKTFINNEISMMWRRAPLRFACEEVLQHKVFALQMRVFPRDIDSFAAAAPYVQDYQKPARVSVGTGSLLTDESGDLNRDGYNESEGCFVVKAEAGKARLSLKTAGRTVFQPTFKIVAWDRGEPATVNINGRAAGRHANVSVLKDRETLLVQLLTTVSRGNVELDIR